MTCLRRSLLPAALLAAAALLPAGCFVLRPNAGGSQTSAADAKATKAGARTINPADVSLPAGYAIAPVATGLTYPTAVAVDDAGTAYVAEAGYSYGEDFAPPRLLRVTPDGRTQEVARGDVRDGMSNGPWTGVALAGGAAYVCEGGVRDGGRLLRIDLRSGAVTTLVDGLPTLGDHHTNGPVARDGFLYFGVGSATNSGVVGPDNARYGWLKRRPDFHDVPPRDVTLAGVNYTSDNPLTPDANDKATTGAFVPFGTPTTPGQVIKGRMPCNGAVLRVPSPQAGDGGGGGATTRPASDLQLVAWGLRNPYGLAFAGDGRLLVVEHSYDVRGSRPAWGTGDLLWAIDPAKPPLWHGWPDYHGQDRMADNPGHYRPPGGEAPKPLLANRPNDPPAPLAYLGVHAGASGADVSRSEKFGHAGDAFVAQFGDLTPGVGKLLAPVGFKVVHVDVTTGVVYDFAVNRGKSNGPASKLGTGGLERPVACRFDPTGDALYVVDFGVLKTDADGKEHPARNTGVLWRVTRAAR
ncbi:MAG TPA: hypothetical protein VF796_04795 [Humisphaera sp.]